MIAALVFTVVLAAQLGIPVSRLGNTDSAQRFGWQMFSGSKAFPQLVVVTASGERDIRTVDYLLRARVEIDLIEALPPHLCEVISDAASIRWDDGSYRC